MQLVSTDLEIQSRPQRIQASQALRAVPLDSCTLSIQPCRFAAVAFLKRLPPWPEDHGFRLGEMMKAFGMTKEEVEKA